jgi:hypothetical protein
MSHRELPRFDTIAATLRVTTERLTREISAPRDRAPEWTEFEWAVARAVSAMHGIPSLLVRHLRWRGPPQWEEFLREQRAHILASHERIKHLLGQLSEAAERANLPMVALKGSALRELQLHGPGDRPQGDIDVLVRPEDMRRAARVIESLGYRAGFGNPRHDVFLPTEPFSPHPFAEHVQNPLRIELHPRVFELLPVETVDITSHIWPASVRAGINPYASLPALLRHVALHTSGNMRANAMRFIQLYDCALLARRMEPHDWTQLMGSDPPRDSWWLYPALIMAERYVPRSIPGAILAQFAAWCPRRLRDRFQRCEVSDVSWSNIRIPALPGIEWARTMSDGWRFARSRFAPSREALAELQDGVVNQPSLAGSTWYRSSQWQRILRWTFGRPPRVQTLNSVRAAWQAAE